MSSSYSLQITNSTGAPDGHERQINLINGQYPGPTIYANWGDWVEVAVTNYMENNGTSIHFHGIRQWYTGVEDGVPGVTECPTAPGNIKVYRWQATQYGTSWYHSHQVSLPRLCLRSSLTRVQGVEYGDGILGPIVIDGPSTANYDVDLGPLPFTDWYYETAASRAAIIAHTKGIPPTEADTGELFGGES